MSKYPIGYSVGMWKLVKRSGNVEMWHKLDSGNYGIYLYEHVPDEYWLLHAIRSTKEGAEEIFDLVVSLIR